MIEQEKQGQLNIQTDPFEQFDNASSIVEKRKLGRELVSYAIHKRIDALSIFKIVEISLDCMSSANTDDKRLGKSMLQQLDRDFRNAQIMHKTLLPTGGDSTSSLSQFNQIMQHIQNKRSILPEREIPDVISRNVDSTQSVLQNTNTHFLSSGIILNEIVPFITRTFYQEDRDKVDSAYCFGKLIDLCKKYIEVDVDNIESLTLPEQLIAILQEDYKKPNPFFPSPYSQKFDRVSIKDVVEEKDPESYCWKMFTLLTNAPEGDIFWRILLQPLAFSYPYRMKMYNLEKLPFKDVELSTKLYSFQWWLTQKMVMPTFDGQYKDEAFDAQINAYLERQDESYLGSMIASNIIYYPWIRKLRDRNFSIGSDDSGSECPIVTEAFYEVSLIFAEENNALSGSALIDFLYSNKERIFENFSSRFTNATFVNAKLDDVVNEAKKRNDIMKKKWEEDILDNYRQKTGKELEEGQNVDQWELQDKQELFEEGVLGYVGTFTDESFPQQIGYDSVGLIHSREHIQLIFQGNTGNFSTYLSFDRNGQRIAMYPLLSDESPFTKVITEIGRSVINRLVPEKLDKKKLSPNEANTIFLTKLYQPK